MKKTGIIVLSSMLYWMLVGCNHTAGDSGLSEFGKAYDLRHKAYDTELMFRFASIQVLDSLLLIFSYDSDNICSFYSISDRMKPVCQYGRLGNGPHEFLQPALTYAYKNTFGLNEVNKQELFIMEINPDKNGQLFVTEKKRLKAPYKMKKGELVLPDAFFTRLDDSHYISRICGGENNFFSLLDSNLQPIERFGESPVKEELSPLASRNRLQGIMATYEGAMFFAANSLPYLASYRLESGKMRKIWSFYYHEPHYYVRNGDLLFDKEKSFGQVLDLDMDGQYIYLLYLDQLLSEYDYAKTDKSLANKVLVFDYAGNAKAVLKLDCRLQQMALSKDGRKLYGISQLPEPTIVEFDLPEMFVSKE